MAAHKLLQPILLGGLIAGVLDITYACVFSYLRSGRTPAYVLQSVASGALGRDAFQGGAKTAALGLGFHFVIALTAAAIYVLASRALPFMTKHPIFSGLIYGLCVYAFMYCVVLRISAIRATMWPWSYPKSVLIGGLLIHMLGVGLPIALVNRHYSK
ncbi:MAG TPA: hypothetical protein VGW32_08250 [Pyrinomonadaceae bacterium]|nr:hypothetical protein [Pyrinomonadaceae bacterium]